MSAFEDEFEVPPASEVDPAAEFLAKEQEELGDIGQDLGLGAPAQDPAAVPDAGDVLGMASEEDNDFVAVSNSQLSDGEANFFSAEPVQETVPVMMDGKDIYAGMQTLSIKKDKEEPEHMRKWKEEQQERLMKKDQEESAAMEELKVKAKQELEDWYKRYETQVEKTKSSNREEETKYEIGEMNGIEPGTEWERVSKHCDFSSKAPGHTKDVSRMRSILLQLKQNQTVKA